MKRHELADEFALTDPAAAQLCARLAIPTSSPDDEISEADAERFRIAARQDLALGPPAGAASGQIAGPSPTAPIEGPFSAPGQAGRPPERAEDVAAGWAAPEATGAWAPGTNGHGNHGDHGHGSGGPGPGRGAAPGPNPGPGGQPSWARSADLARLDAARSKANSMMTSGYLLLALGLAITIGTLTLAPGGFFIISFGTIFVGIRRLQVGRTMRAQIRAAEQQLGPDPGSG